MEIDLKTATWEEIKDVALHVGLDVIRSEMTPNQEDRLWEIYGEYLNRTDRQTLKRISPKSWEEYKAGRNEPISYQNGKQTGLS